MYPKIEGLDLSAMDFTAELPYIQVLLRRCVTTWARAGLDLGLGWTSTGPGQKAQIATGTPLFPRA